MNSIAQLMSLKGRRALITGGCGKIGQVMAHSLAELGADLLLVDRPSSDYTGLRDELEGRWGIKVAVFDCDLEIQCNRDSLVRFVQDLDGGLDILVNNAALSAESGLEGWLCDFENQSTDTWRRALEVNLTAVFDLTKGLVDLLKRNEKGNIVNIASIYGFNGTDYGLYEDTNMGSPAAYSISKGGLIQMTRWLATTLAPAIRVNTISPGGVFRNQPEVFVKRYESRTPLARMATEDDFRGAIAYLASDLLLYVTGQNLIVDGGWSAW